MDFFFTKKTQTRERNKKNPTNSELHYFITLSELQLKRFKSIHCALNKMFARPR